jgi:hypothetical protein
VSEITRVEIPPAPPCPICFSAGSVTSVGLPLLQCTCGRCGWHYTLVNRVPDELADEYRNHPTVHAAFEVGAQQRLDLDAVLVLIIKQLLRDEARLKAALDQVSRHGLPPVIIVNKGGQ